MQGSSATAQRIFGAVGYQEGLRRHHQETSMVEMLMLTRSTFQATIAKTCLSDFLVQRASS